MKPLRDGYAAWRGNPDEKRRIALEEYDRLVAEDPGIKKKLAHKLAGEKAGVSDRQVRTYLSQRTAK